MATHYAMWGPRCGPPAGTLSGKNETKKKAALAGDPTIESISLHGPSLEQ
jgi:hypothetical protein